MGSHSHHDHGGGHGHAHSHSHSHNERRLLLALLLTGASSDGSEGVAAVRATGGRAWLQCPEEAEASMMPASALQHAGADAVLPLELMCRRLKELFA